MFNKYVLFLLLCLCRLGLCRRNIFIFSSGSYGSGDPVTAAIVAGFILLPNLGGCLSHFITRKLSKRLQTSVWLENITRPSWCPYIPGWLYAINWMIMYTLMGYASFLVYDWCGGFTVDAALPLSLYVVQLFLNWTSSPVLYHFRKLSSGFYQFLALDAVTVMCSASFFFTDPIAFYLMLPYQLVLVFLTSWTYILWTMNPNENNLDTLKNQEK